MLVKHNRDRTIGNGRQVSRRADHYQPPYNRVLTNIITTTPIKFFHKHHSHYGSSTLPLSLSLCLALSKTTKNTYCTKAQIHHVL